MFPLLLFGTRAAVPAVYLRRRRRGSHSTNAASDSRATRQSLQTSAPTHPFSARPFSVRPLTKALTTSGLQRLCILAEDLLNTQKETRLEGCSFFRPSSEKAGKASCATSSLHITKKSPEANPTARVDKVPRSSFSLVLTALHLFAVIVALSLFEVISMREAVSAWTCLCVCMQRRGGEEGEEA